MPDSRLADFTDGSVFLEARRSMTHGGNETFSLEVNHLNVAIICAAEPGNECDF